MEEIKFYTQDRQIVPHVSEAEMRKIDRIAIEEFNLSILQMMENAGRNLALFTIEQLKKINGSKVLIFAGSGGNGGGGLCAARHLTNHGIQVSIILNKDREDLKGAANTQLEILQNSNINPILKEELPQAVDSCDLIIDALIGYSLKGDPKGITKVFIDMINRSGKRIISLDIPSGIDATSGDAYNPCVKADQTLTLALPKTGLHNQNAGEIYLADIGIPNNLYTKIGITFNNIWNEKYFISIMR